MPDTPAPAPVEDDLAGLTPEVIAAVLGKDGEPPKPPETPAPALTTPPPGDAHKPFYDDREYDGHGKVTGGSVYYSEEEWKRGTRERGQLAVRANEFARQQKARADVAEKRLRELGRTPPPAPAPTAVTTDDGWSPETLEVLGADVAAEISRKLATVRSAADEAKREPHKLAQQAEIERQIGELQQLAKSNPDLYCDVDMAVSALEDPAHPMYEKAKTLDMVSRLASALGSVEEAHRIVARNKQTLDMEKQIEDARKKGEEDARAKLIAKLREHGARIIPKEIPGSTKTQAPGDVSKLTPQELHQVQAKKLEGITLQDLEES